MKLCIFAPTPPREKLGGFLVANFLSSIFPRKNGLKFVTPQPSENFTTLSTARKEIYHLELALGATSRKSLQNIFRKFPRNFRKLSAQFPHSFLMQSKKRFIFVANFREFSAEFLQTFRKKKPFANDPISELLTIANR